MSIFQAKKLKLSMRMRQPKSRRNVSVSNLQPIQEHKREHQRPRKDSGVNVQCDKDMLEQDSSSSNEVKGSSSDTLSAKDEQRMGLEDVEHLNILLLEQLSDLDCSQE